jgi:hypothetical protein
VHIYQIPEGPEVWILSKAINDYYLKNDYTASYGKHLFILSSKQNWSFGLSGKVFIDEQNKLHKFDGGWICGEIEPYELFEESITKLGLDWMTANDEDIRSEVLKWSLLKKKLDGVLLDQSKISGIGVAWGSEILHRSELRPELRCCDQNLCSLADHILYIRQHIKNIYEKELKDPLKLINQWFENLYKIRELNIYKKGDKIDVLGRIWCV